MSLREQLLKSGLASQQQVKRAERESKKRQHEEQGLKKQGVKPPAPGATAAPDPSAAAILEEQRRADRERNLRLEEERRLQEQRARAIDIMVHNDLSDPRGDHVYYFRYQTSKIGALKVNEVQQLQLAQGQLAIASFDDYTCFYLVSRENAIKLALCGADYLACYHDKLEVPSESAPASV